ncbi:MAG: N-formylglutamate amidohydrolase, partial [Planctomycetes bacterium]|nr:N-formylglutamate amidohydrolase [Planctomycetota bacterium]
VSCEHATASVPARYRTVFESRAARAALASHRGVDFGAVQLARQLARATGATVLAARATRLLADPNRSRHHPRLFSEWSRSLPPAERAAILAHWWQPHRAAVEAAARELTARGTVVHVSSHSFTPVWDGADRGIDVALLYDPARRRERAFADRWLTAIRRERPDLRLARNRPYRGNADGLTTSLRRALPAARYLGLELEVSQRFPLGPPAPWTELRAAICRAFLAAVPSTTR